MRITKIVRNAGLSVQYHCQFTKKKCRLSLEGHNVDDVTTFFFTARLIVLSYYVKLLIY